MNITKQKGSYMAPRLTVVSFHAERGYAASIITSGVGPFDEVIFFEESPNTRQVEVYEKSYWGNEGNQFWQ